MSVPRRYLVAAAVAGAGAVGASAFVAFVLLAREATGATRLAWSLLAGAAGLAILAAGCVGLALPHLRRVWIRSRRDDRLRRIERRLDDLPSRRFVRGVDERIDAVARRNEEIVTALGDIDGAIKALPNTARTHMLFETTSKRASEALADLERTAESANTRTASEISALGRRLTRLESATATSARDLYGQIDGLASLYSMLRPDSGLPPLLADWAVAADLGGRLVRHVLSTRPASIVELGSGVSTVLLAMASRQVDGQAVLAIEHDEQYADRTRSLLEEYGVDSWAEVAVAPLVDVQIEGDTFPWYDLSAVDLPALIDLLIVDGPPGNTGSLARFPAVPVLRDRLTDRSLVVLDDARRDDEQVAVERWCAHYGLRLVRPIRFTTGTAELVTSDEATT